ncbi:ribonuclease inhibitor [Actinospica durhamensis]|uniref:Ribonuclease inhibitor n=1 Tax=Actinospica durhamensis TaxID=1508375 RepID=A0A941INL9_9ACTN|nr:ribonuclease inhibitor [Actinospica durhamensis]
MGPIAPRPGEDLLPLIAWLRTGRTPEHRLDFPAGTALPDGRLDLCKQAVGPEGVRRVVDALPDSARAARPAVRHLLLGTDGLGDAGAGAVAAAAGPKGLQTLYLGCNGVTAGGVCRMADNLRASPQAAVGAVWLKRNPLGPAGGDAAARLLEAAEGLRTLDLVQTGLDAGAVATLTDALISAVGTGRGFERVYLGGNALGAAGASSLARLVAAGGVAELYVSAAGLGAEGAQALAEALECAPPGRLRRLSAASNGIGPAAASRLVAAAAHAGVELLDLGRVRAARVLAAPENRIDEDAAAAIGTALAAAPHRLAHLVLTDTGMRSREALSMLRALGVTDRRPWSAPTAEVPADGPAPIRIVLGKGIAATVKRRFAELAAGVARPASAPDVAAVRSVYRTAQ